MADPWITGYVVERREFRVREDGYLYFPGPEDTLIWKATMTVGTSTEGYPGYSGLSSGPLMEWEPEQGLYGYPSLRTEWGLNDGRRPHRPLGHGAFQRQYRDR